MFRVETRLSDSLTYTFALLVICVSEEFDLADLAVLCDDNLLWYQWRRGVTGGRHIARLCLILRVLSVRI